MFIKQWIKGLSEKIFRNVLEILKKNQIWMKPSGAGAKVREISELGGWFCGWSPCCTSVKTMVQLPRTCVNAACHSSLRRWRQESPRVNWIVRLALVVSSRFDWETPPLRMKQKSGREWFPASTSTLGLYMPIHVHSHTCPHMWRHVRPHTCTTHMKME